MFVFEIDDTQSIVIFNNFVLFADVGNDFVNDGKVEMVDINNALAYQHK